MRPWDATFARALPNSAGPIISRDNINGECKVLKINTYQSHPQLAAWDGRHHRLTQCNWLQMLATCKIGL